MRKARVVVCAGLLLAATGAQAGTVVPVTSCGQEIDAGAQLVGDLDCPTSAPALIIRNGSLDLNGFTIDGGHIACDESCTVSGPGTLNVDVVAYENLTVRDLSSNGSLDGTVVIVERCTVAGAFIYAYAAAKIVDSSLIGSRVEVYLPEKGRARVENTLIQDAPGVAVLAKSTTIIGSTIVRSAASAVVSWKIINSNNQKIGKATIIDSTIAENGGSGVIAGTSISVRDSTIRDNAGSGLASYEAYRSDTQGVAVGGVKLMQSTVSGNGEGVIAHKAYVADSSITANEFSGITASSLTIRGLSDLRGNRVNSACGTTSLCFDVVTVNKPYGANVSNCDTSWSAWRPDDGPRPDGSSWGVCALD